MAKNDNIAKIGTFNGIIIYHYDFKNKEGIEVKCTKYLFNINGMAVFVNAKCDLDKSIGSKVMYDLGYDGKNFVVL